MPRWGSWKPQGHAGRPDEIRGALQRYAETSIAHYTDDLWTDEYICKGFQEIDRGVQYLRVDPSWRTFDQETDDLIRTALSRIDNPTTAGDLGWEAAGTLPHSKQQEMLPRSTCIWTPTLERTARPTLVPSLPFQPASFPTYVSPSPCGSAGTPRPMTTGADRHSGNYDHQSPHSPPEIIVTAPSGSAFQYHNPVAPSQLLKLKRDLWYASPTRQFRRRYS